MITPKLKELQDSILSAFETRFGTINRGLKSTFRVISQVLAGELRLVYLFGASVQKNVFADLADPEVDGGTLERFGRAKLGRDPFPASQGLYLVDVTGVSGGVIRAGVVFKAANGYNYSNETALTLTGATGQISLRALTPGLVAKLNPLDTLNATEPILNVDGKAIVNQEIETPLNAEDIEDYRQKILLAFRTESQGGASGDYRLWSADAQGVEKVYPFVGTPGTINLYVEATEADSTDGFGTPTTTILTNVEDVCKLDPDTSKDYNDRGRLPMGVFEFNVLPIVPIAVDLTVSGYNGNTSEAQTLIAAALKDYLKTIRPYVAGADELDASTLSEQRLIGVVSDALPIEYNFTTLSMSVGGTPVGVYQFVYEEIPRVGAITVTV